MSKQLFPFFADYRFLLRRISIQLIRFVHTNNCRAPLMIIFFVLLVPVSDNVQCQSNTEQNQVEQIAEARRRVDEAPKITRFDSVVVNVPMVGTKTLPLVEAKLNGKGPYKLLVDSGANVTLLQMHVADELKLPVLRPGEKS